MVLAVVVAFPTRLLKFPNYPTTEEQESRETGIY